MATEPTIDDDPIDPEDVAEALADLDAPYEYQRCGAVARPSDLHEDSRFCWGITEDEWERAFRRGR